MKPHLCASPERAERVLGQSWRDFHSASVAIRPAARSELRQQVAARAVDLADYQNAAYADEYLETLRQLVLAEAEAGNAVGELAIVAARGLYRVMAYRDLYELARLLRGGYLERWATARVGPRTRGLLCWAAPLRRIRGTRLDPLSASQARRRARRRLARTFRILDDLAYQVRSGEVEVSGATRMAADAGLPHPRDLWNDRLPTV